MLTGACSPERVAAGIQALDAAMAQWGLPESRVAVIGFNPSQQGMCQVVF